MYVVFLCCCCCEEEEDEEQEDANTEKIWWSLVVGGDGCDRKSFASSLCLWPNRNVEEGRRC